MKVHCAEMYAPTYAHGDAEDRPYRQLHDGTMANALCGNALQRIGGDHAFKSGGDIVPPTAFQWLPIQAQCGNCQRLFNPFGLWSLRSHAPCGQRWAPRDDEHVLTIEAALHAIARVWET